MSIEIPKKWYNIQADVTPLPPPRYPVTGEPLTPEDLALLFPKELILQEVSTEPYVEIPEEAREIIVSPIGGQGFIFGRGNQQISPEVIWRVGVENVVVIAAPEKLMTTSVLHVDTGDVKVDSTLKGEHLVVCGYRLAVRKEVV